MSLFQNSVVNKYLATQDHSQVHAAYGTYLTYFHNPIIRENIRNSKEEQFQEGFLRELFVKILGYTINPEPDFNLTTELKNIKDSKKTDGAILKDGKAIAVIELKGTDTKDLEKIRDQAFNYKNNQPECVYVITSNFEKLRFYIHNAVDHQEFSILSMSFVEFKLFWLFLHKDNLLKGIPLKIKEESLLAEELVTKKLYADYSAFKEELWQDMVRNNPGNDELLLYKKSQKLLDRFLFIFFAEDKGLLPPNSISEIVKQWDRLSEMDEYRPLYDRFKKYFGYMNSGRVQPGKAEIHAYNGGLFAEDPLLDSLKISDALLKKHVSKLTEYDFQSEVDTNILGHIFEHSLNDIENVRASLEGTAVDKSKTKRKKDGVFYTPKYITKYIVENTVGKLCIEKKAELGIVDEDFSRGTVYKTKEAEKKRKVELNEKLTQYRNWLLQLSVCDPACGSGAFLNQVLEFLMAEHRYLDELESMLFGSSIVFPNVENHILENNIFGVDINEESVEIARLSLWLRTAQKGRKLSTLSSNIKVGNSLIDDPEVAGELAFNWQKEFPQVFAKGGFDVVVGNPPYVDLKGLDNSIVNYIFMKFKTSNNRVNLYSTFIEKSKDLISSKGRLSFIIPSSILTQSSYKELRSLLLENSTIENIVRLPNESFGGSAGEVKVDTIIITFLNEKVERKETEVIVYKGFDRINEISKLNSDIYFSIDQNKWANNSESIFKINSNATSEEIIEKIEFETIKLIYCADFCLGLTPYDKYKGHSPQDIENRVYHSSFQKDPTFKKLLAGNDIRRYNVEWGGEEWISYGKWLGAPRESKYFTSKRILVKQIIDWSDKRIWSALTDEEFYNTQNAFNLLPKENFTCEYLIALINSKLMSFYHKKKFLEEFKDRFQKILIKDAKLFPIKVLDLNSQIPYSNLVNQIIESSKEFKELNLKLVNLIMSKYSLNKPSTKIQNWPSLDFKGFLGELTKAKVKMSLSEEAEWMAYFKEQKEKALTLQSDITRLDREIDQLVYELYGLTEEEIRIVEGGEV
jgi:type I restriction-modification system DNA methylase subunit